MLIAFQDTVKLNDAEMDEMLNDTTLDTRRPPVEEEALTQSLRSSTKGKND